MSKVSPDAIIEGVTQQISLGTGTIIRSGAVLSTKHSGWITLGQKCVVHRGAMILAYGGKIEIGDYCNINPYTILYGHGGLSIGNNVLIAAHTVVIPTNHSFDLLDTPINKQQPTNEGITIGDDVWVGAHVTILDGVHIGDGAVIGAGTVVTKDIIPYSVNVGNPARVIKMRI